MIQEALQCQRFWCKLWSWSRSKSSEHEIKTETTGLWSRPIFEDRDQDRRSRDQDRDRDHDFPVSRLQPELRMMRLSQTECNFTSTGWFLPEQKRPKRNISKISTRLSVYVTKNRFYFLAPDGRITILRDPENDNILLAIDYVDGSRRLRDPRFSLNRVKRWLAYITQMIQTYMYRRTEWIHFLLHIDNKLLHHLETRPQRAEHWRDRRSSMRWGKMFKGNENVLNRRLGSNLSINDGSQVELFETELRQVVEVWSNESETTEVTF